MSEKFKTEEIMLYRDEKEVAQMEGCEHVVRHSPTGIEWGYGGSGPADCARSILIHYVGTEFADQHYQEFKREMIAGISKEGRTLSRSEIMSWVRTQSEDWFKPDPPRMCFFIPADAHIEGRGFRVSIVKEGESGHYPTGVWPNDGTQTMPYFWGDDYEKACEIADQQNERLGLSKTDVVRIVASSMAAGNRRLQKEDDEQDPADMLVDAVFGPGTRK